jgi:adenylate cyclase
LKNRITFIVPLIITVFFALLAVVNPLIIDEYLETLLTDYRFKIRNVLSPLAIPDNIIMVLIDEKSLLEFGRWPWNRKIQAELIEKVFEEDPKVVAVDIFYPEPESPASDRALSEVMKRHSGRVVCALGFEVEEGKSYTGEVPDVLYSQAVSKIKEVKYLRAVKARRVLLPPDPIAESAAFGHVYSLSDRDGKLRWENLYIQYGDEYFYSFALKTAAIAKGIYTDQISIVGGTGVDFGGEILPTDAFGRLHINYYGKEGVIRHISAADVLSGKAPKDLFRNEIVLIGTSAIATYDLKSTPFSANTPGVEKNATVIANILNGNFIRRSPLIIDLSIVLLAGLLTIVTSYRLNALRSIAALLVTVLFIIVTNQIGFAKYGIRMNLVYPLFTVMTDGMFIISYRYFIEEKKARDIRKMFSCYVTEKVVNELIRNPDTAKLGGERREITVLFADISGFTSFSEKHKPEEVVATLNEYLSAMTDVIFKWEGTLDKFIGDAIVAFWGAPLKQDNHAELAVRCSLHMIKRLEELHQKWMSEGKTPLNIGIGLNTGEVVVGNIGAEGKKMDYTVIGDHVNIGARVESLTRTFKTNILITELPLKKIMDLVRTSRIGHISVKGVGNVVVKGREKPIKIYEIRSLDPSSRSVIAECEDDSIVHMKEK